MSVADMRLGKKPTAASSRGNRSRPESGYLAENREEIASYSCIMRACSYRLDGVAEGGVRMMPAPGNTPLWGCGGAPRLLILQLSRDGLATRSGARRRAGATLAGALSNPSPYHSTHPPSDD